MKIEFKKIHPNAKLPVQAHLGDAGWDLHCVEDFTLYAGETKLVTTGLQLADMPENHNNDSLFLQIEGRSGLAVKGVFPLGGIVDSNYRGEMKVILHNGNMNPNLLGLHNPTKWPYINHGHVDFKTGDRIAQLIIRKIVTSDSKNVVQMVESEEVSETNRGSSGYGSTGS